MARISTPCINVCTIDPDSGLCTGCARTVEEIATWLKFDEPRRQSIMRELPARRRRPSAATQPPEGG
ncbi:MAG: DUF1289 domain-containing protein [Hyphomicrobiaceae bacterium]|nr:DUF1289 domain-containing protein [Hyphomicrobiaceae bacterium]